METNTTKLLLAKRDARLTVRVPKDLKKFLELEAKKAGLELSDYVVAKLSQKIEVKS